MIYYNVWRIWKMDKKTRAEKLAEQAEQVRIRTEQVKSKWVGDK